MYLKDLVCHSLKDEITPEMQRGWQEEASTRSLRNSEVISPVEPSFETPEARLTSPDNRNFDKEGDESADGQGALTGGHLLRPNKQVRYGK